jgi:DNA polymerase-3 subunit alpha
LLYQEQVLQIFRYAGFPEDEVDNARRAIGKKKLDVMAKLETEFREKLSAKGWTTEQLDQLWELILKQTGYSFNRGHSVSYGLLSYLTAYLKYHYPVAFMTACLNADSDDVSRIGILINECYKLGINILPPKINKSRRDFTAMIKEDEILFGLQAIKGLGDSVVSKILENRPYTNINDFIDRSGCSKSHIVQLIKAGAFGTEHKRGMLLKYFDMIIPKKEYKSVKTIPSPKEDTLKRWGIDSSKFIDPDKKKNNAMILELYNQKRKKQFDQEQAEKVRKEKQFYCEKYLQDEYLWEFETLSMFLTNNPLKEVKDYITDWNDVEQGSEGVLLAVVVDLKRKKDKNNNVFAYIDLYTVNGIIESVAWSSIFKEYNDLLQKGQCIALLGRKGENNQMFIKKVKNFQVWLSERKMILESGGELL